jgi:hypothetical protein
MAAPVHPAIERQMHIPMLSKIHRPHFDLNQQMILIISSKSMGAAVYGFSSICGAISVRKAKSI